MQKSIKKKKRTTNVTKYIIVEELFESQEPRIKFFDHPPFAKEAKHWGTFKKKKFTHACAEKVLQLALSV